MLDTRLNPHIEYKTWDTFKRELESNLGRWLTVDLWLRTKPKKPLPWNDVDLQTCLLEVLRVGQEYERSSKGESDRFYQVRMHK
jgi:hypothetical protein